MKFFPLIMMAFGAMIVSCERHDFESTRRLHDKEAPAAVETADQEGDAEAEH